MKLEKHCAVLVIGAGPGGYVAAIRAGQLGLNTIIVDDKYAGGTCLNKGCIPSKALIHAATRFEELSAHFNRNELGITLDTAPKLDLMATIAWKNSVVSKLRNGISYLLKKANTEFINGKATFSNAKSCVVETPEGSITIRAEHVILATGSKETEFSNVPFSKHIISSTEALALDHVPDHLAIIGAGYIGMELGIAYRKLGAKVSFIESQEGILPTYDKELKLPVEAWLKKHQVEVICSARVQKVEHMDGKPVLYYTDQEGQQQKLSADKVLVAVGRKPNTQGWGLENMCIDMENGFIKVDDRCRTSMKNVWAIGDLVGEPMLAHKASSQGEMVAEIIAGHRRSFDPIAIPAVCFTEPQIASVGLSPSQAKAQGHDVMVGKFPFSALGKAQISGAGEDGGFVQITARKDNGVVLGIRAVGAHVAELVNEFTLALEMGACLEDLAKTIHAHPTIGEATMEASMVALGKAIHTT